MPLDAPGGATNSSTVTDNNRISSDGVYNYTYDDEGGMLTKTSIATGDFCCRGGFGMMF